MHQQVTFEKMCELHNAHRDEIVTEAATFGTLSEVVDCNPDERLKGIIMRDWEEKGLPGFEDAVDFLNLPTLIISRARGDFLGVFQAGLLMGYLIAEHRQKEDSNGNNS